MSENYKDKQGSILDLLEEYEPQNRVEAKEKSSEQSAEKKALNTNGGNILNFSDINEIEVEDIFAGLIEINKANSPAGKADDEEIQFDKVNDNYKIEENDEELEAAEVSESAFDDHNNSEREQFDEEFNTPSAAPDSNNKNFDEDDEDIFSKPEKDFSVSPNLKEEVNNAPIVIKESEKPDSLPETKVLGEQIQQAIAQNSTPAASPKQRNISRDTAIPVEEKEYDEHLAGYNKDRLQEEIENGRANFNEKKDKIPEKYDLNYTDFLLLQFFGKVSYSTLGQMNRYLTARKTLFEPELEFYANTYQKLVKYELICQTSKTVKFSRGEMKGKELRPFYLTNKGKLALGKIDSETASVAKYDEPNAKMFTRLEHELLISEIFVLCFEQGKFVFWLLSEEQMRSNAAQKIWNTFEEIRDMKYGYKSLGDFRIAYIDTKNWRKTTYEGEIAVKYRHMQVKVKPREVRWFCYDAREAAKIILITGRQPEIVGTRLLDEFESNKVQGSTHRKSIKRIAILEEWMEALGGLTVWMAQYVLKIGERTVFAKLNNLPNVAKIFTSIKPGTNRGRGLSLYFQSRYDDDFDEQRTILALNLTLEVLLKNNFTVKLEEGIVKVFDKKGEYRVIVDAGPRRMEGQTGKVFARLEKIIDEHQAKNLGLFVGVMNGINYFEYGQVENLVTPIDLEWMKDFKFPSKFYEK